MRVKLLIVDDEPEITRVLSRYFTLNDYEVATANSGEEAYDAIVAGNYQVVISDIMMPGISGIELLEKAKAFNGMIQFVMITGVVTIENVLDCLQHGANDCFLKPLDDLAQLKGAVDDAIGRLRRWEGMIGSMVKRKK